MANIQDVLYRHHPGVQVYVQARELSHEIPAEENFKIGLYFDRESDRQRYNLPTGANEIAAILPGDGDQPTGPRDIIVRRRGGGLMRISELDRNYYPLHYVVLFPTGQPQWHPNIPYGVNADQPAAQDEAGEAYNRITQIQYFAFRLHPRPPNIESNHFFRAHNLFQQYGVDAWATAEQARLNFLRFNQDRLRADVYREIADAIAEDADVDGNDLG
ncbi:hypothetical protein PAXINDRAFT_7795 [Paxillus involutus ATCC 200175]|nr:hypothetical protein PAXINDRAFT_7795 [Paxillus involutus ATCC 200175]